MRAVHDRTTTLQRRRGGNSRSRNRAATSRNSRPLSSRAHGPAQDRAVESQSKPRVVVVTGASAGVGRAIPGLAGAQRDVEKLGGRAVAIPVDVADAAAVEAAAGRAEAELGPIDAWVNSAMASLLSPIRESRPDEIRRVTEVTYLGTV